MKELTIEQKAKAYDEAIKRASKLRVQNPFDTVSQMMEHVFPELKESEDERVRNKLIEFFKGYSPDEEWWGNITQEDILSWLEKQGGQKSTEWDEYDEMYVNALVAIVRKRVATDERLRDELIGWLSCLKCRLGE